MYPTRGRVSRLVILVLIGYLLMTLSSVAQAMTVVPNTASDLDNWNLLLGVVSTFLAAVINNPTMNRYLRVAVVAGLCVLAAIVTTSLNGELDWHRWLHSFLIVLVVAVGLYHTLLSGVLTHVEDITSPKSKRRGVTAHAGGRT
jgi:small basic protein